MNKKKLNLVLILFLVVIWGLVFNKFFNATKSNTNSVPLAVTTNSVPVLVIQKDTFDLREVPRDPFLGKIQVKVKKKTNRVASTTLKPKKKLKINKKKLQKKVWPKLKFYGFVKGQNRSSMLCLIKVNNKFYKKREKENIEELILKKVFKDSLIAEYKGETKTIIKVSK